MRKLYDKLLDALLGKRYHPGWPRGVRPIFPASAKAKTENEEFWNTVAHYPPNVAIRMLREKGIF